MEERSWAQYSTVDKSVLHRFSILRCRGGVLPAVIFMAGALVAVAVVCMLLYHGTEEKFNEALQLARSLKPLDTSRNRVPLWLKSTVLQHRQRSRGPSRMGELAGPGIKMPNSFHWTNPDDEAPPKSYKRGVIQSPPAGKSLRMPLGIASDFTLEGLKVYEDSETSEGITPHHTRSRLETLSQKIPASASLAAGDAQKAASRGGTMSSSVMHELKQLLKLASDSRVGTEVAPQSPLAIKPCHPSASPTSPCSKAHRLRKQLTNLMEMSKDLSYQDVMLYPGQEKEVLYCGWFKGLQFDGAGTLFYSNPQRPAYVGEWSGGAMDGRGTLYDSKGAKIWNGQFVDGLPVGNLFNLLHNIRKGFL